MKRSRFSALISTTLDTKQSPAIPPCRYNKQESYIWVSSVPFEVLLPVIDYWHLSPEFETYGRIPFDKEMKC